MAIAIAGVGRKQILSKVLTIDAIILLAYHINIFLGIINHGLAIRIQIGMEGK